MRKKYPATKRGNTTDCITTNAISTPASCCTGQINPGSNSDVIEAGSSSTIRAITIEARVSGDSKGVEEREVPRL